MNGCRKYYIYYDDLTEKNFCHLEYHLEIAIMNENLLDENSWLKFVENFGKIQVKLFWIERHLKFHFWS